MESRVVLVYVCEMRELRQPIPRHHIASITVCRKAVETTIDKLIDKLTTKQYQQLERQKQLTITNTQQIKQIINITPKTNTYLKIKIKEN